MALETQRPVRQQDMIHRKSHMVAPSYIQDLQAPVIPAIFLPAHVTTLHLSITDHLVRPQFRSKIVCEISCRHCNVLVCKRGMKAILLADTNYCCRHSESLYSSNVSPNVNDVNAQVELYSTDLPPFGVQLVLDDYQTRNCQCRIRDVACLGCGNVLGYHVSQPCESCLDACNNGHFWMFHLAEILPAERMDSSRTQTLLWAQLPRAEEDDKELRERIGLICR
eukprot:jgi/Hompol1/1247/HPOL_001763-RA